MARRFARKHLDYTDIVTEAAAAVYMVIIINGYVSLSQLNTQFYYILAVDIGACLGWGFIDGFTYGVSGSIERGNQAKFVREIQSEKDSNKAVNDVVGELDDTFLSQYSDDAKRIIALEILKNSSKVTINKKGFMTRDDLGGLAAILSIYLTWVGSYRGIGCNFNYRCSCSHPRVRSHSLLPRSRVDFRRASSHQSKSPCDQFGTAQFPSRFAHGN